MFKGIFSGLWQAIAAFFSAILALFSGGTKPPETPTTTVPAVTEPTVTQPKYNDGVFEISDLSFSVDIYNSFSQSVTDREDSANYGLQGQAYVVCDHYYQGFDVIKNVNVGTTCTITLNDGTVRTYECAEIHPHCEKRNYTVQPTGVSVTGIFTDYGNGDNVFYLRQERMGRFYLVTYTCNVVCQVPSGEDVYVVLWRPVS